MIPTSPLRYPPRRTLLILLVCMGHGSLTLFAQRFVTAHIQTLDETNMPSQTAASVSDMAWLAGKWVGSGLGGSCEEMWSEPKNGVMMGMFRYDKEGSLTFTEHFTLTDSVGTIRFRLKHFHADLRGWEEKDSYVDFPFIGIEGTTAYFDGVTIDLIRKNHLRVYVLLSKRGESPREEMFVYRRQRH